MLPIMGQQRRGVNDGAAVRFLVLVAMFVLPWLSILLPAMRDRIPLDGSTIFLPDQRQKSDFRRKSDFDISGYLRRCCC